MREERRERREVETMTCKMTEERPAGVPEKATQAGETQTGWGWVEPSVWTWRMLTALERGVKGGKWFSLIDKVYARENLLSSFTCHCVSVALSTHWFETSDYLDSFTFQGRRASMAAASDVSMLGNLSNRYVRYA